MYSQFAVEPKRAGRGSSADVATCETPLQQIWFLPEKKTPAVFIINHPSSLFLSSLYWTGVGLMERASKEIFRSKSKKSY